ncbi:MAG: hypothetical protein AMXMBFR84_13280 [Candidatus Hydrogenedentota bacterium]
MKVGQHCNRTKYRFFWISTGRREAIWDCICRILNNLRLIFVTYWINLAFYARYLYNRGFVRVVV